MTFLTQSNRSSSPAFIEDSVYRHMDFAASTIIPQNAHFINVSLLFISFESGLLSSHHPLITTTLLKMRAGDAETAATETFDTCIFPYPEN